MIRTLSLAAAAALFALPAVACDGFEAHDAYARVSTRMSHSGAVFMTLHNHGDSACHLIGARSDVAARVELHTHIMTDDGVMQMREVEDGFMLDAGGTHELARGGDHVMLMGLHDTLEQGQTFTLTLEFADGSEATLDVPVDNERMPMNGMSHGAGHDSGHGEGHGDGHDHMHNHGSDN